MDLLELWPFEFLLLLLLFQVTVFSQTSRPFYLIQPIGDFIDFRNHALGLIRGFLRLGGILDDRAFATVLNLLEDRLGDFLELLVKAHRSRVAQSIVLVTGQNGSIVGEEEEFELAKLICQCLRQKWDALLHLSDVPAQVFHFHKKLFATLLSLIRAHSGCFFEDLLWDWLLSKLNSPLFGHGLQRR